ncbi:MAG: pyridoxamine 5'-phosphate oxidase family protein [Pseudomonadota bacterium]
MLTAAHKRLIEDHRLGFVATVDETGSPNLSPKGTFLVHDDETVLFGEIRSPATRANLETNAKVEINFVDVIGRKGVRLKGVARFIERESEEFEKLYPPFLAEWGRDLCDRFNGIVWVTVHTAKPLTTPAYDIGATEAELRAQWFGRYSELQERET